MLICIFYYVIANHLEGTTVLIFVRFYCFTFFCLQQVGMQHHHKMSFQIKGKKQVLLQHSGTALGSGQDVLGSNLAFTE